MAMAPSNSLPELMAETQASIDAALALACDFGDGCPESLREAIKYSLLAPGKRLRPFLVVSAAQACGGTIHDALPAAVAVEMIHAYSLVHDDLPAMDDDDLRRGRPTAHIRFGEATAILAGDALQAEAFAHLQRHVKDPVQAASLMGELARASGASGLVGGQCDDLTAESVSIDEMGGRLRARQWLESIHRRKTGALFAASVRMGAISAGADSTSMDHLTHYADSLGLAFQIVDDILDVTASDKEMGKRTNKDTKRGKLTYPGLLALDHSVAAIAAPSVSLEADGNDNDAQSGDGLQRARVHAEQLIRSAQTSLTLFGDRANRLHRLADFVLERKA
ncbi:MAG: polyprenyl synthetase family protein [Planctomycetota bacterium]